LLDTSRHSHKEEAMATKERADEAATRKHIQSLYGNPVLSPKEKHDLERDIKSTIDRHMGRASYHSDSFSQFIRRMPAARKFKRDPQEVAVAKLMRAEVAKRARKLTAKAPDHPITPRPSIRPGSIFTLNTPPFQSTTEGHATADNSTGRFDCGSGGNASS